MAYYKLTENQTYFACLESAVSLSGKEVAHFPKETEFTQRALKAGVIAETTKDEYDAWITANITQNEYEAFLEEKKKKEMIALEEKESKEFIEWKASKK